MKHLITIFICFLFVLNAGCENPTEPGDKKTIWVTPLEEAATAGIAMDEDFIYFGGTFKYFYKVDKTTGEKTKVTFPSGIVFGTPVICNNQVFAGNNNGVMYAFEKNNMKTLWKRTDFSWVTIPVVDDMNLYLTEENKVSALSKENGNTSWNTEIKGRNVYNPPIDEGMLYIVTGSLFKQDGYLYCLDKMTGTIVFKVTIPYMEDRSQFGGSAAGVGVWNEYVYVPADNRYLYCFNKYNGELVWKFLLDATPETPARISDGIVYTGTRNRTCYAINAETGELVWSFQTVGSIARVPPQFYGNNVAFISGAITICNKKTGELVADISSRTNSKYDYFTAIWDNDGKMYLTGFENPGSNKFVVLVYQF